MTLATLKGRLQTKVVSYIIALTIASLMALLTGQPAFFSLFAVMAIVGLILETIWGLIITHQPGWLALPLGIIEFACVVSIASLLQIPISFLAGATYYFIAWIITLLILVYLFPVWHLRWIDKGREIW